MIVVGILTKENKVLIGKVKASELENFGGIQYVFPGGTAEEGEALEAAVIREMQEETGYVVSPVKEISSRIHPKTGKEMTYYHCEVLSGAETTFDPKNDDIERLIWVDISKISTYMPTVFDKVEVYLKQFQNGN
jgi:8-oxo-dGTP diphosphatase